MKDVNPITFFGQQVVEKHPIAQAMGGRFAGLGADRVDDHRNAQVQPAEAARPRIDLSGRRRDTRTSSRTAMHARFSDPLSFNGASVTAAFSPAADLPTSERVHLRADYRRYDWNGACRLEQR